MIAAKHFFCLVLLGALLLFGVQANAQDISATADLSYYSKYVWRGMLCNGESIIQPSATISHTSGFAFNAWGSYDLTNSNAHKQQLTEIDYTLSYSWKPSVTAYSAGLIRYEFPNTSFSKTHELFVSAAFDYPLSPVLSLYYDFDAVDGMYANFGISKSCAISGDPSAPALSLSAKLGLADSGYTEYYFAGHSKAGFTDACIGASMPIKSGKFTITPSAAYTSIIDGGMRDAYSRPDNLVFGLTISSPL